MWSIFHTITFFEKALKRSGVRKGNPNLQNFDAASTLSHPLASHLSWMLPPLIKVSFSWFQSHFPAVSLRIIVLCPNTSILTRSGIVLLSIRTSSDIFTGLFFQMLRAMHSLWFPPVTRTLPRQIKAAMVMSDSERSSLLGEGNLKVPKGALTFTDGSQFDINKEGDREPNETDIRNWLKGIRDSGYVILNLCRKQS